MNELPEALRLERVDTTHFLIPGRPGDIVRDVVFGGQLLAHMIVASATVCDWTREVKSIHAIFARAGSYQRDQEIDVDSMHAGRSFGSDTVTVWQDGKVMSRGLLLLTVDEPDLLRHATPTMPDVPGPDEAPPAHPGLVIPGAEIRLVHGLDTWRHDLPVGPPERCAWTRFTAPLPNGSVDAQQALHQAILAWATDGFLIGTAMLPYADVNEDMAHRGISTGVVSHTVNFHDRFDAREWLLISHEAIWAGRGRTHGRATVFTREGKLVATFTQDNMIRSFTSSSAQTEGGGYHRVM